MQLEILDFKSGNLNLIEFIGTIDVNNKYLLNLSTLSCKEYNNSSFLPSLIKSSIIKTSLVLKFSKVFSENSEYLTFKEIVFFAKIDER